MRHIDLRRQDRRLRSVTRNVEVSRHARHDDRPLQSASLLLRSHVGDGDLYVKKLFIDHP